MILQRGTHRHAGNPSLGTFSAFLTLLVFIRIAANLYLAIDLWGQGSAVNAGQIAGAHFVFLTAYGIMVGSLSAFRISFSLPRVCFIDFPPGGKTFRQGFIRRVAFLRPFNLAFLAIFLAATIVFAVISGNWPATAAKAITVLAVVAAGIIVVITAAARILPSPSDTQLMETLCLLVLVGLNPDIVSIRGQVGISFWGFSPNLYSFLELALTGVLITVLTLVVIFLVRLLTVTSELFHRQTPSRPLGSWYRRFIRIKWWVLLYAVVLPLMISPGVSVNTKRWALAVSVLFGAATYAYFISQCDNTLREKWRLSLFDKGNIRLLTSSILLHILLTAVPLAGYFVVAGR